MGGDLDEARNIGNSLTIQGAASHGKESRLEWRAIEVGTL